MEQIDFGQRFAGPAQSVELSKESPRRLLIVSHVTHYQQEGKIYAYGPYAREIDIWADLFEEVTIAAPCRKETSPKDCLAFTRPNIFIRPQLETGGRTLKAKAKQVMLLPALIWGLCSAMRRADAIHVRYPANVGLLGALLAPLFSRRLVGKYAGQWNGYEGERAVLRLQRALLRSRWWRGPVTVYGDWPNYPPQVISFFTAMMTDEQVRRAAEGAGKKRLTKPLRVLFSGRLASEKRVDALLEAVKLVSDSGVSLELAIVGDGPERPRLEGLADELGISHCVKFYGALPFDENLTWYEWAHCLVLPSVNSEGWPKVIAEGMCHGLVCVAVKHGQVPAMLTGRGVLLETGTPQEIAAALRKIEQHPEKFESTMRDASQWARRYSLEGLRDALSELLSREWKVNLRAPLRAPRTRAEGAGSLK